MMISSCHYRRILITPKKVSFRVCQIQMSSKVQNKKDIFKKYFKKIKDPNNFCKILAVCNYCGKQYVFSGGYGSLWKHITNKHASEAGIDRTQQ